MAAPVSPTPNLHRQMSGPIALVNCSQGWIPLAWPRAPDALAAK